jgi:uncharacterized membrane protein YidH (DUF202 family)
MTDNTEIEPPVRPERITHDPLPNIPDIAGKSADEASVEYSHYRTGLSHHRTGLSEHRTDLSEFRTDLSSERTEMSMRRTGMSIQRTRMSADRTLMSEIRTSLSLIGFGFTLYQAFSKLQQAGTLAEGNAPRNFGFALIALGILIMAGGIWRHVQFALELRRLRTILTREGLIHGQSAYPVSISLIVAVLLLLLGVAAIVNVMSG